ncbi:MAG: carbohydrate-binding family 9-like protein [Verrucomicrobiota bacterium]|nr:carbohydrate-binding family 9-like protein [Verrucomicrobiota bacterium]
MISRANGRPILACARRELRVLTADPDAWNWRDAQQVFLLETVSGAPPKQATSVRALWSLTEWRLLFHAEDTHPWATLTARDAPLYQEEVVEVFFDPVGDLEAYFEIEVNPLGAIHDLISRRNRSGYRKDLSWNCEGLRAEVRKTTDAWSVELRVPFSSVTSEPPRPGCRWRANFLRIDRPAGKERELSAWSPTRAGTFHVPERFGIVDFVA